MKAAAVCVIFFGSHALRRPLDGSTHIVYVNVKKKCVFVHVMYVLLS